jgi:hypothetical protein
VNVYGGALLRFWWVVGLGVVVAVVAAASMAYNIPELTPRESVDYTAKAQLLVTSLEGSYVRLSVPRVVETPSSTEGSDSARGNSAGQGESGQQGGPLVVRDAPDVKPLLAAANLYPILIESDQVRKLREKMFGPMSGTVQASALAAVSTPTRFEPSELPVIEIFATSGSEGRAIALANATSKAFKQWIKKQQDSRNLSPAERVIIQELVVPRRALASGGPSFGIPVLVALAVLAAFGILALLLDRIFPRGAPKARASETT